jgi:hypothetical protein
MLVAQAGDGGNRRDVDRRNHEIGATGNAERVGGILHQRGVVVADAFVAERWRNSERSVAGTITVPAF